MYVIRFMSRYNIFFVHHGTRQNIESGFSGDIILSISMDLDYNVVYFIKVSDIFMIKEG